METVYDAIAAALNNDPQIARFAPPMPQVSYVNGGAAERAEWRTWAREVLKVADRFGVGF